MKYEESGSLGSVFLVVLLSLLLIPVSMEAQQTEWRPGWNKIGPYEGATIPLMLGTAGGARLLGSPEEPNWRGPVLFDEALYDLTSPISDNQKHTSRLGSDILVGTTVAYPFIADFLIAPQYNDVSSEATFQAFLVTTQSLSAAVATTSVLKYLIARKRPGIARSCSNNDPFKCPETENLSFPSGHTTVAFTAAFSTCVNHKHLAFYGDGTANQLPCYLSLGAATATGLLRVVGARHYGTDVLAGAVIGFGAGYLLPKLIHYNDESDSSATTTTTSGRMRGGMRADTPIATYSSRW